MGNRNLWLGTGILALAAGAVALSDHMNKSAGKDDRVGHALAEGPAFLATADRIEIKKSDRSVVLTRDADKSWRLGDGEQAFPASAEHVAQFFDSLERAKIEAVAATKKDGFYALGLTDAMTITVKAAAAPLLDVLIGDARKGGGVYVAYQGQERAYLNSEPLAPSLDADQWELKTLLNLPKDLIKEVVFVPPPSKTLAVAVTLSRDKKEDDLAVKDLKPNEKSKPAAKQAANSAEQLNFTKRGDRSNEAAKAAMADAATAKITTFDGKNYEIKVGAIGDKDKKTYVSIAVPDGDPRAPLVRRMMAMGSFEVAPSVASRLDHQRSDFVEAAGDGAAPQTVAPKAPTVPPKKPG